MSLWHTPSRGSRWEIIGFDSQTLLIYTLHKKHISERQPPNLLHQAMSELIPSGINKNLFNPEWIYPHKSQKRARTIDLIYQHNITDVDLSLFEWGLSFSKIYIDLLCGIEYKKLNTFYVRVVWSSLIRRIKSPHFYSIKSIWFIYCGGDSKGGCAPHSIVAWYIA